MQTQTAIAQITSLPHGVGVSIVLNIEHGGGVLSSEPLAMFTLVSDRGLAEQLAGLNGLILARGWPALSADQVLRISAVREAAAASEADIAALTAAAAAAAVTENAALAAEKIQLQADRDGLKAQLDSLAEAR